MLISKTEHPCVSLIGCTGVCFVIHQKYFRPAQKRCFP
nr:MAG TPA: hypothetical protein [Caudoviricetes sp.]